MIYEKNLPVGTPNPSYKVRAISDTGASENIAYDELLGAMVHEYLTYADLPNPGNVNNHYKVTQDPTTANNGYYHWDGTVYVKDSGIKLSNAELADDLDANSKNIINLLSDRTDSQSAVNTQEVLKINSDWLKKDDIINYTDEQINILKAIKDIWFDESDFPTGRSGHTFRIRFMYFNHSLYNYNLSIEDVTTAEYFTIAGWGGGGINTVSAKVYSRSITLGSDTFTINLLIDFSKGEDGLGVSLVSSTYDGYFNIIEKYAPTNLNYNNIAQNTLIVASNQSDINLMKSKRLINQKLISNFNDITDSRDISLLEILVDFWVDDAEGNYDGIEFAFKSVFVNDPTYGNRIGIYDFTNFYGLWFTNLTYNKGLQLLTYPYLGSTIYVLINSAKVSNIGNFTSAKNRLIHSDTPKTEFGILYNSVVVNKTSIDNNSAQILSVTKNTSPAKTKILLMGSSISAGNGSLVAKFGGETLKYIYDNLGGGKRIAEMTFTPSASSFNNPRQLWGEGKIINGIGSKITFDIYGDELNIFQVIKRTADYGIMKVKADGVQIGTFDNRNETLGSDTDNFTGDASGSRQFELSHPYTYNHVVTVGGITKTGYINTGKDSEPAAGNDYVIIRKRNSNGDIIHVIRFATTSIPADGEAIVVSYDYGKVIYIEKSTVGQTTDDETNESYFGIGKVSFDPANPADISSGLEYRSIDKSSIWTHKFTSKATRTIEIEITGGNNPYFIINFASTRFHDFANCSIGGWKLSLYLDEDGLNDWNQAFQYFVPDILFLEMGTNDDWTYSERKISRTMTGLSESQAKDLRTLECHSLTYQSGTSDYTAVKNTGIITSITKTSLIANEIIGSNVAKGDLVRIGNYYGDNKQVVIREIDTANLTTGEITWLTPLNIDEILNISSISDLVGAEIAIRDLSAYKALYQTLIGKIQTVSPATQIVVVQTGLSNYFERQLWGYNEIHRQLSIAYHNVSILETNDWLNDFQNSNISESLSETVTADGSSSYVLAKTGGWQGFKVMVNGVDVYGKDCYILSGSGYKPLQTGTGSAIDFTGDYNKENQVTEQMKLVFFQNAPSSGNIEVIYADSIWSGDFTHTNDVGAYVYGQIYSDKIKALLK